MDYHKTMESYFQTKASMFTGALGNLPKNVVLNFDDPRGKDIAKLLSPSQKLTSFAIDDPSADIRAENLDMKPGFSTFTLVYPEGRIESAAVKCPGTTTFQTPLRLWQ